MVLQTLRASSVVVFDLQLTCYAEFNRMVQAIARNEREGGTLSGGLSALPGAHNM